MQVESKIGFVFLHSCDRCNTHPKILSIAQQLLLQASRVLTMSQAPPSLPAHPQDYVGIYTATVGKTNVSITTVGQIREYGSTLYVGMPMGKNGGLI